MKLWKTLASVVVTLAAIAGVVYVIATYGERIVAWARNLLNRFSCSCCCDCECDCEDCECDCECDCCCCEEGEETAEEPVVAEQNDFEG